MATTSMASVWKSRFSKGTSRAKENKEKKIVTKLKNRFNNSENQ